MGLMMTPVSVLGDICLTYFLYFSFSVQSAYQSEIEEYFDYDNRPSVPILNSCKSMVAWFRAAASLSRSKIFRIAELPNFHVVHLYLRSDVSMMTNLEELMQEIILPNLSARINNAEIFTRLKSLRREFPHSHGRRLKNLGAYFP